jgi:hypothetical protein
MEFLVVALEKRITFPIYYIWACCAQFHNQDKYYSIQFPTSSWIIIFADCDQVYDFSFMHNFQALPLKLVKVQTNTSLLLRETNICLNVLKLVIEDHLQDIHDFTQFHLEVTNDFDLHDDDEMYHILSCGHQDLFCK